MMTRFSPLLLARGLHFDVRLSMQVETFVACHYTRAFIPEKPSQLMMQFASDNAQHCDALGVRVLKGTRIREAIQKGLSRPTRLSWNWTRNRNLFSLATQRNHFFEGDKIAALVSEKGHSLAFAPNLAGDDVSDPGQWQHVMHPIESTMPYPEQNLQIISSIPRAFLTPAESGSTVRALALRPPFCPDRMLCGVQIVFLAPWLSLGIDFRTNGLNIEQATARKEDPVVIILPSE
jgi:hypothetical protein